MDRSPSLTSQTALARASKVAQSYLSRVLRGESAATVDTIEAIAKAFTCAPWELLVDSEAIRRVAIERVLAGPAVPDERVAQALGEPPGAFDRRTPKKSAMRLRKR